ncbi:hypothetical protein [Pseudoalteromonas rubra]|uniref:Uncharacterized protein n=1 Tax=Pseudoalteromonas rubra TaxID=43658 RepID=A0A0F4QEB0_9GAMM|nr:hypothetical protein [Pseudoalteromonas rubra]KJZ05589.1 hypothetical protein TW77_21940 [Pseudoalteromonas rubra]
MEIPRRVILPSLVGAIVGYAPARQLADVHAILLSVLPILASKNALFLFMCPLSALMMIMENKYFWGRFMALKTHADIWGVAIGFQIGFVTLSIYQ